MASCDEAIADAFPGAGIEIVNTDGYFELEMQQHGLLRPLKAAELSDGTLRYLLLIAALLSPRPPSLMILNEPETSLHPDLLPPLARLIAQAAKRSQIVVVSHAVALVSALAAARCAADRAREEAGRDPGDRRRDAGLELAAAVRRLPGRPRRLFGEPQPRPADGQQGLVAGNTGWPAHPGRLSAASLRYSSGLRR